MESDNNHRERRTPTSASFRLRSESLNTVRLRRIFEAFDRNGDGEISVEELGEALRRLGMPAVSEELHFTISELVPAGANGLDFSAFCALHRALGERMSLEEVELGEEEELWEAFRVFDEDGDGFISASELRGVLSRLGLLRGHENEVESMICGADANHDGLVDFGEFKLLMSQGQGIISVPS